MSSEPKKQSSQRKTGLRRSHLVLNLARRVNSKSPVKVKTTRRETGKKVHPVGYNEGKKSGRGDNK